MEIDKLIVLLFCIGGIGFTYWFFLMKRDDKPVQALTNSIDVTVEGGYVPSVITIPKGKATMLRFIRLDPSPCLEEIVLSEFKIRKYLPQNVKSQISITPKKKGIYELSCGMNMHHMKIVVE